MKHPKLILLDYSGTLCIDAVRFGEPAALMSALGSSGLAGMGVTGPDFFWNQVVIPTWIEGSTTGVGYAVIMERRLGELLDDSEEELRQAVRRFTDSYFASFRIEPRWEETLHRLRDRSDISVVIATDHYAEATGVIMESLAELAIEAARLGDVQAEPDVFMVANSADLGCRKTDRRFWEGVLHHFPNAGGGPVILVDDFRCNETGASVYGTWPRVLQRRDETATLLEAVFHRLPQVITFFGSTDAGTPDKFRSLEDVIRDVARVL